MKDYHRSNPNLLFNEVETLCRELLGREYKRYFKKNNLVKEAENKIKDCLTKKHQEWFGDTFLNHWKKDYYRSICCCVYFAVHTKDNDSWLADVYSDAFLGRIASNYENTF